jgi:hypothetical protein
MLNDALFVSDRIHEKEVELADGSKHILHFKELSAIEFRKFALAEQSEDNAVRAASMSHLIAASLCDPEGKPALTAQKAATIKPMAFNAIFAAIMEVNGQKNE